MQIFESFKTATARPRFFLIQALKLQAAKIADKSKTLSAISKFEDSLTASQEERLNYYLKHKPIKQQSIVFNSSVHDFKKTKNSLQYFDLAPLIKRFDNRHEFNVQFGDITEIPEQPTFVKSRPIEGANENSVLLKLGSLRHFHYVRDNQKWNKKRDSAIWRGHAHNPNRQRLIKDNVNNARVDAAQTNQEYPGLPLKQPFMPIYEQLKHKFIISIEGHDVATNLKWAMRSNSIVISPKLKYETWFMEGTLKAGEHYIEVKDDYSDIDEKIDYYLTYPKLAYEIIENANRYTDEFLNHKEEQLLNLLVIKKYFETYNS